MENAPDNAERVAKPDEAPPEAREPNVPADGGEPEAPQAPMPEQTPTEAGETPPVHPTDSSEAPVATPGATAPPEAAADELDFLGRRIFKVGLDVYNGPLDLLLYLIKRDEIDIYDIPVAHVAEEYSNFVDMMADLSINTAGDFLVMAATLMEIKSAMLLPDPPLVEEDEEYEDPRTDLVRQLMEYKRYKEAALDLSDRAEERARRFARPGEKRPGEDEAPLVMGVDIWQLADAFEQILASVGQDPAHHVVMDETPQKLYMERLVARVENAGRVRFHDIFRGRRDRATLIGMFLALLELCRLLVARAEQAEADGDIWIVFVPESERPGQVRPLKPREDTFVYAEMDRRPEEVWNYAAVSEDDFTEEIESVEVREPSAEPPAEDAAPDEAPAGPAPEPEAASTSEPPQPPPEAVSPVVVEAPPEATRPPVEPALGRVSVRVRWLGVAGLFRCPYSDWRPVRGLDEKRLVLISRRRLWRGMKVGLLLDAATLPAPVEIVGVVAGCEPERRGRLRMEVWLSPFGGERGENPPEATAAVRRAIRALGGEGEE